jgi:hypothetical protein
MNATDNQKWAIVREAKRFYDLPAFKKIRQELSRLNFYNLPEMSKQEASDAINTMQEMFSADIEWIGAFFQKWIVNEESMRAK